MRRQWPYTALLLLLLTLPAAGRDFAGLDSNSDGRLGQREWSQAGLFSAWDRNADGSLDGDELPLPWARLADWDIDGDSHLSEIEFSNGSYGHADLDGNGSIDATEFDGDPAAWFSAGTTPPQAQQPRVDRLPN